ncbi:polysaccharide pyruvyl transferase family protein [Gryllotalpicola reticulitermitis]|uniref:Polysaccharide pyruvyl transferase family protein n=1 Tax=Gryllotalpicola reticulitermitis TaxID=1184153 RepID=A0ABV8Q7V7_9MICO
MSALRVGAWGVFGRGNFGNEAMLQAFLGRLDPERYAPVIICERPDAAAALHGVPARVLGTPVTTTARGRLRRLGAVVGNRLGLLRNAFRVVGELDAVVLVGSGGLERYGAGSFGTPFDMWSLALAGRMLRRPVLLLDVGIEVLPRRLARAFARGVARGSRYRAYRDESSRASAAAMGMHGAAKDAVVTDLALGLPMPRAAARNADLVVVGVMNYSGRDDRGGAAERYRATLAELVRALRSLGMRVRLVGGDEVDLHTAAELAEQLRDSGVAVVDARSPEALVSTMHDASAVIASRYHTLIMALLAGTPTLSIGYGEKHRAMLQQLGLPPLHFDIEEFEPDRVAAEAVSLAARQGELTPLIEDAVESARSRLDRQWSDVERVMRRRAAARA